MIQSDIRLCPWSRFLLIGLKCKYIIFSDTSGKKETEFLYNAPESSFFTPRGRLSTGYADRYSMEYILLFKALNRKIVYSFLLQLYYHSHRLPQYQYIVHHNIQMANHLCNHKHYNQNLQQSLICLQKQCCLNYSRSEYRPVVVSHDYLLGSVRWPENNCFLY